MIERVNIQFHAFYARVGERFSDNIFQKIPGQTTPPHFRVNGNETKQSNFLMPVHKRSRRCRHNIIDINGLHNVLRIAASRLL